MQRASHPQLPLYLKHKETIRNNQNSQLFSTRQRDATCRRSSIAEPFLSVVGVVTPSKCGNLKSSLRAEKRRYERSLLIRILNQNSCAYALCNASSDLDYHTLACIGHMQSHYCTTPSKKQIQCAEKCETRRQHPASPRATPCRGPPWVLA